jgi:hypothetical protein
MKDRDDNGRFIKGHSKGLRFGHGQKMGDRTGKPSSMKGKHLSEETKKKISVAQKGKHLSEECKKKISASLKGKRKSEEHRQKIIGAITGRKRPFPSEETRIRMSKARKGRKKSEETRLRMIKSARRGSDNHFWKGGITPKNILVRRSPEYNSWRKYSKEIIIPVYYAEWLEEN